MGPLAVILNSFQDPGAVSGQTSVVHGVDARAWMLKQVQHDESPGKAR